MRRGMGDDQSAGAGVASPLIVLAAGFNAGFFTHTIAFNRHINCGGNHVATDLETLARTSSAQEGHHWPEGFSE